MNFTKNAHFNHHSLPHHKWCDIYNPQNPLFFKFQKNPQKQNILDKMQNGHFWFLKMSILKILWGLYFWIQERQNKICLFSNENGTPQFAIYELLLFLHDIYHKCNCHLLLWILPVFSIVCCTHCVVRDPPFDQNTNNILHRQINRIFHRWLWRICIIQ